MALTKVSYSMIQGEVLNVLDFGADNTGSDDCTEAFQAAVDQAIAINGSIFLPDGTYKQLDTVTVSTPIAIFGSGCKAKINLDAAITVGWDFLPQATVFPKVPKKHFISEIFFVYGGTGKVLQFDYTGPTNVYPDAEILGNQFDLTGSGGYGIWQFNTRGHIIRDNQMSGTAPGGWTGIYQNFCFNSIIQSNIIWSSNTAINIYEGEGVRCYNNDITEASLGIKYYYHPFAQVTDNLIDWCGHGVWFQDCWNSDISSNYVATGGSTSPIYVNTSVRAIEGISIINNKVLNYLVNAPSSASDVDVTSIYVSGTSSYSVTKLIVAENVVDGYRILGASVNYCGNYVISNNTFTTTNPSYSYSIDSKNSVSVGIIENNVPFQQVNNGISAATGDLVVNNVGYATEISSYFTVNSGSTTASVTFAAPAGLNYVVNCCPTGNVGSWYITSLTNTGFTFNCSSAPGSNTTIDYTVKSYK